MANRKGTYDKKPIIEAIKELVRVAIVAIIPLLIVQLQEGFVDTRVLSVAAAIALLRAVERGLHYEKKRLNFEQKEIPSYIKTLPL